MKREIQKLAKINLTQDLYGSITENMILERRKIVKDLADAGIITLEEPHSSGKFYFNEAEGQEIYLEAYNS
jgi:hypothetical protein